MADTYEDEHRREVALTLACTVLKDWRNNRSSVMLWAETFRVYLEKGEVDV